jgi:UDP-2-acetamido-2,6-beta-L-arabino-hexul-4-ose reductase
MSPLKIAITGAGGFIGKHLHRQLAADPKFTAACIEREDWQISGRLREVLSGCHAVIHLAAMNRGNERELYETNVGLVQQLCQAAAALPSPPHLILASSTQREGSSSYAQSKRDGETVLAEYAKNHHIPATVLVVPNVFGPGCRPFYNSVVATFCHQLARNETPQIQEDREVPFVFVADLAAAMIRQVQVTPQEQPSIVAIQPEITISIRELLSRLEAFRDKFFGDGVIPSLPTPFDRKLYATWMSHVDMPEHCHRPKIHADDRGSLFEIIKTSGGGQVFFSTTRPGVIRGNHFHTRKIEWFCVVRGEAVIRLRKVGDQDVHQFRVSGENPQFISIPAFHSHSIENVGMEELLTMFWCSELFVPSDPDTYFEKVA